MPRRDRILYRSDIRQKTDRPTNSIIVQYVGSRRMDWLDRVYGYDEGVFFVCNIDEMGYPPELEELASKFGIDIDQLPGSRELRLLAAEALAVGATVDAPALIGELAEPPVRWLDGDRRELERKHMIAVSRLAEHQRLMAAEIRRRCAPVCAPIEAPAPPPPVLPAIGSEYDTDAILPPAFAESEPDVAPEVFLEEDEREIGPSVPSSVVQRVRHAVQMARETELPQRLPGGVRRRLNRMPPGVYIAFDESLEPRADICAAITDARAAGRKGREVTLIDHDGEWPVAARRYGAEGRVIYKVEDALRRHGVDIKAEVA